MESSLFSWYFISGQIFLLLAPLAIQAGIAGILSNPGQQTVGYVGRTINFTWTFSNSSLIHEIYFETWNTIHNRRGYPIIYVSQEKDGNITVKPNQDTNVQEYRGRIRWAGDIPKGVASFELSGIRHSDKRTYAIELYYGDDEDTEQTSEKTKLTVQEPSRFSSTPGDVSCNRGQDATFSWHYILTDVDSKKLSQILFGVYKGVIYKPICVVEVKDKLVAHTNCSTGVRKSTSHFTIITPQSTAKFVLNNVDVKDEAVFSIRLVGTSENMEGKVHLVVRIPPKILARPKDTNVLEGSALELICKVDGKPWPNIKWLKDNKTLETNSTGYLTMIEINREDSGFYQCVAENEAGRVTSEPKAMVNVQYPPVINSSKKVNIIPVPIGATIWLTCETLANPPATVEWHGNRIPEKHNDINLRVKISNSFDYANYTCVAKNPFGQDNVTFDFRQVGPPSKPQVDCDKDDDTILSRSFAFHWRSPKYNGGADVLLYSVKHRSFLKPSERNAIKWKSENFTYKKTWHKFTLEWDKKFEFTVTAWNIYGESTLDVDNTCLISVGNDPSNGVVTQLIPTEEVVAAAAKKNLNNSKQVKNLWTYVGVGAGVFGLALLLLIAYLLRKRRNTKKDDWYNHHTSFNAFAMESSMLEGVTVNSHLLQGDPPFGSLRKQSRVGSPRYQMDPEWYIPREKICIVKVIGNGAFGLVYKGRVHGVGANTLGWNLVAIKSPYADASDAEVRDLMKEFELMKTLKPHPHVIKLLGCGEDEGRPLVIIEYVPFGDLLGYLRKSRGENDDYYSDPEIKPKSNLSSQQLLRFGWHTADGMAYLASQKILHRDLAARNVLVGDGLSCKVTDFGMAKDISNNDIYIRSTEGRLPVKWTAIEALTGGGEYTTKSDVWSFGVVLYEICTIGAEPFPGISPKEIPQHVVEGYRMKRPGHVDPELYDVMMSCWETNPDGRPTFPELKETLMKLEEVQSRDYINLKECMYQNVGPGSVGCTGKLKAFKGSVRGNPYHVGPELHGQVTAV